MFSCTSSACLCVITSVLEVQCLTVGSMQPPASKSWRGASWPFCKSGTPDSIWLRFWYFKLRFIGWRLEDNRYRSASCSPCASRTAASLNFINVLQKDTKRIPEWTHGDQKQCESFNTAPHTHEDMNPTDGYVTKLN